MAYRLLALDVDGTLLDPVGELRSAVPVGRARPLICATFSVMSNVVERIVDASSGSMQRKGKGRDGAFAEASC